MREDLHFEPYVHLAGLSDHRALISWGGFFFHRHAGRAGENELILLDDEELETERLGRNETIGEQSEPYGDATVRVRDASGAVVGEARTRDANHVWIDGLRPDTEYKYEIAVDGRDWLVGERYDWARVDGRAAMRRSGRQYGCCFRTHPARDAFVPVAFAVLGDFGIGIRGDRDDSRRQAAIARGLERAVAVHDIRFVLTTGDNIYLGRDGDEATGAEDDDWFFSFYQPYRYVMDHLPFYPTVGNHDSAETEATDDRSQLDDNYFLYQRFHEERDATHASVDPGLFYRFEYGATAAFVCIDTTKEDDGKTRYFEDPRHAAFLNASFPKGTAGSRQWRIPFSHHPVYCAGPEHGNTERMLDSLVPLFERSGVQLVLAGHEHNFQYSRHNGIHYVISGAGGQLRPEPPTCFSEARTVAWAAEGHFLVVCLDAEHAVVHALTADAEGVLAPLVGQTPEGTAFRTPIVIDQCG